MERWVPALGFLVLSAMVVVLLGFTVYEAWALHSLGGFVVAAVLVGAVVEMVREGRRVPCAALSELLQGANLRAALALFLGALLGYVLSVDVGLGAVTAASLVGLMAAAVVPAYAVPAYCGSFVGMTSARLLINHGELAIAALVAALIYLLTLCAYPGLGGKLGTIAFTGSVITGWGLDREFLITPVPAPPVILEIIAYAVVATVVTYWLNHDRGRGPVMASALVSLVGGLVLPALDAVHGPTLAVMVMCASFAGMSSRERFPRGGLMAVVGLVAGAIFIYSMPTLGGAGGKLGTIAFGSALAVQGYAGLLRR